jgi:uncharacterized protein DUF3500
MSGREAMTSAATALLAALDPDVRAEAVRPFPDDSTRRDWTYVPRDRIGLALDDLDRPARAAVHRLLAATLRAHSYAQVAAIMALEDVLDQAEGGGGRRRRDDYHLVVFGEPGAEQWGWRFEGHHVSLNITVVDGEVAATPLFLGANPAIVADGDVPVLRPLVQEEEAARALLDALDGPALQRAVVADEAPHDITTRAAPSVTSADPIGVSRADLAGPAVAALDRLVGVYLRRLALPVGDPPADVAFTWAGPLERGRPHYYRLVADGLLIEYDNTQNRANHIHTVLRDPGRDFGDDLLAAHYAQHD